MYITKYDGISHDKFPHNGVSVDFVLQRHTITPSSRDRSTLRYIKT